MTALTLAKPDDIDRLIPLIGAFHADAGIEFDDATRRRALEPLLEGSPHGVIYIVGPVRAPIGYVVVSFGWSLEFGGMDGFIDELFIRPGVRGRGIGTEILSNLPKALAGAGLRALHLEVHRDNEKARALYQRMHFEGRDQYCLMTRRF